MAAKKRKIINRRQLKVAEIWERNPEETSENIAKILEEEFGIVVTRRTVSRDIIDLDKRVQAESVEVVKSVRDRLLNEYQIIYAEAMAAWERSLEDKQVITNEAIEGLDGKNGQRVKVQERTEGQSGNPALLAQAQNALKAVADLFGVDEAKRLKLDVRIEQELDKTLDHLQSVLDAETFQKVIDAITNDSEAGETSAEET